MPGEYQNLPCPTAYVRLLLQASPKDGRRLLAHTGLTEEALAVQPSITVREQLQIFRNARALSGDNHWALNFGRQLSISSHGPLGFAAISAPTLGEGMATLADFARIRAPYAQFSIREGDGRSTLCFETDFMPLGDFEASLIEILMQVGMAYVQAVLGGASRDIVLCFSAAARGRARRYRSALAAECAFSQGVNGLSIPSSLKNLPCPLRDERLYRASLLRCRESLDAVLDTNDVVQRANQWLATHFEHIASQRRVAGLPRLEQLADAWQLTPRTVIRQLAKKGARFQELREAHQLQMAKRMLDDASYKVHEIAHLLGYGDPANFSRAFTRLAGMSPGAYRRRQHTRGAGAPA